MEEIKLRYGMNPHQGKARLFSHQPIPIKVLNGEPSYINILDALNSFQLVKELKTVIGLPAAASFKHVSPAGVAVYSPLSDTLAKSYFVENMDLSELGIAYARARGADRMSSFGDCAAFSDTVDKSVANLLKKEVSDMIVAPRYDVEALDLLKKKKNGKYLILEIDPEFEPDILEQRTVFGMTLEQERNNALISNEIFSNIVTEQLFLPESAKRDLLIAAITLKYSQSNSVCFAVDGQTIGIGTGQQSRIHCTRLAANKADNWFLRQHPITLNMKFKQGIARAEQNNAIDKWLSEELTVQEEKEWVNTYEEVPARLSLNDKKEWLKGLKDVSFASDAFLPFRDNLDRASLSGVRYVVQSGSSLRDDQVLRAANEYKMVMVYSGIRLFHH